jgi:hypothetical protein
MHRLVSAGLAAALVAGLGMSQPASAADGRNAALFGGLAAGAIVGGALVGATRPAPVYVAPPPPTVVYEEPPPVVCHRERRPLYDEYGNVAGSRMVRVCE